jgi:hypothetical protein
MIGPGIWRETLKTVKIEKCTLQGLEFGKKTEKVGKLRNTFCRNWNMARKLTSDENEKLTW